MRARNPSVRLGCRPMARSLLGKMELWCAVVEAAAEQLAGRILPYWRPLRLRWDCIAAEAAEEADTEMVRWSLVFLKPPGSCVPKIPPLSLSNISSATQVFALLESWIWGWQCFRSRYRRVSVENHGLSDKRPRRSQQQERKYNHRPTLPYHHPIA